MTTTTKSSSWQHTLLRRMSEAKPQPFIMGGYAEDALLYQRETRPHSDIDWMIPREQLEEFNILAKDLGFSKRGTFAHNWSGEASYVAWTDDESFWIECVISDVSRNGNQYIELGKFKFDTTGLPPLKPLRIYLPDDTYDYPETSFESFKIKTISPLAVYQIRVGLSINKTFGKLREKDKLAMASLKKKFFPKESESSLLPRVEYK